MIDKCTTMTTHLFLEILYMNVRLLLLDFSIKQWLSKIDLTITYLHILMSICKGKNVFR